MGLMKPLKQINGCCRFYVFSDKAIQDDEQEMIDFLNDVETKGVRIIV